MSWSRGAMRSAVVLGAVVAGACSSPSAERDPVAQVLEEAGPVPLDGPLSDVFDLDGLEVRIGAPVAASSEDATDALLAAVTEQALTSVGATVVSDAAMENPFLVRDSVLSGEIDLAWEGVGAAWTVFLREPADALSAAEIHAQLRAADRTENGVAWLAPASVVESVGFATSSATAAEQGLATLSDMAARLRDDTSTTVCVTNGFARSSVDGLLDLEAALGRQLGPGVLLIQDDVPIYPNTGEGECTFGQVQATSGRIPEYDLLVLEDDLGVFLPNVPAPMLREDLLRESPDLASFFATLAAALTPDAVQGLNQHVVVDGAPVDQAAADWLRDVGLTG